MASAEFVITFHPHAVHRLQQALWRFNRVATLPIKSRRRYRKIKRRMREMLDRCDALKPL